MNLEAIGYPADASVTLCGRDQISLIRGNLSPEIIGDRVQSAFGRSACPNRYVRGTPHRRIENRLSDTAGRGGGGIGGRAAVAVVTVCSVGATLGGSWNSGPPPTPREPWSQFTGPSPRPVSLSSCDARVVDGVAAGGPFSRIAEGPLEVRPTLSLGACRIRVLVASPDLARSQQGCSGSGVWTGGSKAPPAGDSLSREAVREPSDGPIVGSLLDLLYRIRVVVQHVADAPRRRPDLSEVEAPDLPPVEGGHRGQGCVPLVQRRDLPRRRGAARGVASAQQGTDHGLGGGWADGGGGPIWPPATVTSDCWLTYDKEVTDKTVIDMRVGPEGRVVIPASIRRHLGVAPGDNLRFLVLEDGHVEIVSPRMLAMALWANNTGGDAVDSGETVRALRQQDQQASARSEEAQDAWSADERDVEANTSRLLREMDLGT